MTRLETNLVIEATAGPSALSCVRADINRFVERYNHPGDWTMVGASAGAIAVPNSNRLLNWAKFGNRVLFTYSEQEFRTLMARQDKENLARTTP